MPVPRQTIKQGALEGRVAGIVAQEVECAGSTRRLVTIRPSPVTSRTGAQGGPAGTTKATRASRICGISYATPRAAASTSGGSGCVAGKEGTKRVQKMCQENMTGVYKDAHNIKESPVAACHWPKAGLILIDWVRKEIGGSRLRHAGVMVASPVALPIVIVKSIVLAKIRVARSTVTMLPRPCCSCYMPRL